MNSAWRCPSALLLVAAVLAACSASGVQANGEPRVVEVAAGEEAVSEIEAPDPGAHTFDVAVEATSGSPGPDVEWWFVSGTGRELAHVTKNPADAAYGEGCTTSEGEQGVTLACVVPYPVLEAQTGPTWETHIANNGSEPVRVTLTVTFASVDPDA